MAADSGIGFEDLHTGDGEYHGFSDFQFVSRRVAIAVDDAISAYALLESIQVEGAGVEPQQVAEARARIVGAAMRLVPEMEAERDDDEKPYDQILTKWQDGAEDTDGYLNEIQDVSLYDSHPPWLRDFVTDIRRAAWHIGYLKAGKRASSGPETIEQEVETIFEGLNN